MMGSGAAPERPPWRGALRRAGRHWPLLPGLAVAAWLRFARLLSGFHYGDEAEYAIVAGYLAEDPRDLAYPEIEGFGRAPFVSQPPLLLYLFALAARLTGSLEAGPLLVSALLGTATVGVVYALGATVRDRWMGGAASLFLAVLPFHVGVSRSAQLDAGFTFFFASTLLCLAAWTRRPTRGWALAAGLAGAATALSKLPGILVFVPALALAGAWAARLWWRRRTSPPPAGDGPETRRMARHLALAVSPVALLGALYLGLLWHLGATRDLWTKLGWQAGRVTGAVPAGTQHRHWHWYLTDPRSGLPEQLGWVIAALALLGGALVAWEIARSPDRRAARLLLLLWPAAVLAFFLASERKEWFYVMPATPAAALLAAWAVHWAGRRTATFPEGAPQAARSRIFGAAFASILVVASVASPLASSLEDRVLGGNQYGSGVREAALWIHAEDPGAAQAGTVLGRFGLHFYNGQRTYHYFVNHTFMDLEAEAGRLRFVVDDPYLDLPYEREWMSALVDRHGGVAVQSFSNDDGRAVVVYELRP